MVRAIHHLMVFTSSLIFFSYPVPKEVGKVGTESPTFIEPVSQRRDGIQAMFAKQIESKASPSSSQNSPAKSTKRKREASSSPLPSTPRKKLQKQVIDLCEDEGEDRPASVEKLNAWEDDSDVEYVDKQEDNSSQKVCFN